MIQRIQTVYLAVGALLLASLYFFSTLRTGAAAETFSWYVPAVYVLAAACIAAATGFIFMYKNRELQRTWVQRLQFLVLLLLVVLFGGQYLAGSLTVAPEGVVEADRLAVLVLPLLAYITTMLARRSIEKDIKLIRSMDRLR